MNKRSPGQTHARLLSLLAFVAATPDADLRSVLIDMLKILLEEALSDD